MSDPRISRFSDETEQSSGEESSLKKDIPPAKQDPKADQDMRAIQSYADYISSYTEWKSWLAKLSNTEDRLESISIRLEHITGDATLQQSVLEQWRIERLRWHDLTRLAYIALHRCASCMTEYHNLLTEVYNDSDAEVERLRKELKEANRKIEELSAKLKQKDLANETETADKTPQISPHSPVALTEEWDSLETESVEIFV